MMIVGESINGSVKMVVTAIMDRKVIFLKKLARVQYGRGVQLLDVNPGLPGGNEVEDLPWLIDVIDVRDQSLLNSVYASKVLINQDPYCLEYLQAYRNKKIFV